MSVKSLVHTYWFYCFVVVTFIFMYDLNVVTVKFKSHLQPTNDSKRVSSPISSVEILELVKKYRCQSNEKVFYNRVPKCGSTSFLVAIRYLTKRNRFKLVSSHQYRTPQTDASEQMKFMVKFKERGRIIVDRHYNFVDYSKYNLTNPVYINLIREPAERRASWFYWERKPGHALSSIERNASFDDCVSQGLVECHAPGLNTHILPFFCGHKNECWSDFKYSLMRAQENVRRYYAVVGVLEDLDGFIEQLEFLLPEFFRGLSKFRIRKQNVNRMSKRNPISEETKETLKVTMKEDYEFYHFIKQRQYSILQVIRRLKGAPVCV